jgi:hypothetical protein
MVKIDSIPVGQAPFGLAIDPSHGAFGLVANSGSGTVTVLGVLHGLAVNVGFDFSPNTLNLKSMGNWVMGTITVPAPYHASDILVSSLRLNGAVPVDPAAPIVVGTTTLKVKFLRSAVELVVSEGDHVPVTVTGSMGTRIITGTDTIRVIRGKVNNPHAGQIFMAGQMTTIQWDTPNGVHAQWVAILHSLDKGVTWILDTTHLPNNGSYAWHVPYQLCDSTKVAVVLVENEEDTTLTQVDGVLGVSGWFRISTPADVAEIPSVLSFAPIRPNPASGVAMFRFGLPRRTVAELDVFDVQGRLVRTLVRGEQPAGWHEVRWSGVSDGGPAGAGIYFVRLRAEGREFKQRIVWLR